VNSENLIATARRTRGMTLTEVMIGACVLALVLGGSLLVMQRNFRLIATARDLNLATQILQNEVEHMRLANWTTLNGYATSATTLTLDSAFTDNAQIRQRFTLVRTKSVVQADLVELVYTVRWTGADGKVYARSIRTQCAKLGLNQLLNS
jgi:Tfp pilus assembly protein PilV